MKNNIAKKSLIILLCTIPLLDYFNIPSSLGLEISNINWDLLNIFFVILLYAITFFSLDKLTLEHEKNKNEISIMLFKECYSNCQKYIYTLSDEIVTKYIIPKLNFNKTNIDNPIIINLQNAPFVNERVIMDLAKDGQISSHLLNDYFSTKQKYQEYINMRLMLYDAPELFGPLKTETLNLIESSINTIALTKQHDS